MTTLTQPSLDEGYRSVDSTIYDVDEKRHQVAVSIPHESLDAMNTDFKRGAFADSFRRKLPPMLAEHNPRDLIGHAIAAEVRPQDNLLVGQFSDLSANPTAKRYYAHIRDGDIKGWSFKFSRGVHVAHPVVRNAIRYTRADMDEFSATAWPAIPNTQTLGIRSRRTGFATGAPFPRRLDRLEARARSLADYRPRVDPDDVDLALLGLEQELWVLAREGAIPMSPRQAAYMALYRLDRRPERRAHNRHL
jgi:HK97 family phage prohead protease